jgi:hypothetical protein
MPAFLTDHEIDAIRKGRIFIGMSAKALYVATGLPIKTDEAVVGSTQPVYHTSYVYLDNDKKVEEIQDHG